MNMDATTVAAAAFGLQCIVQIVGAVWAVANIKADFAKQIAAEREETMTAFAGLKAEFLHEQKQQDHNFGEVGAAMRQYIANVEKEMHEIEIWGRDNFVLKDDFVKATDRLEAAIVNMASEIKTDLRGLTAKIDAAKN
jgi:hypothetical protein